MSRYYLEICASSVESAIAAQRGGADRIELCDVLPVGGVSPSYGMISLVRDRLSIPIHVLLRPRSGDFLYDDLEAEQVLRDIEMCSKIGVEGVVIGALNKEAKIDIPRCREWAECAKSNKLNFSFHRAIDRTDNILEAMEVVISLGYKRILTSGGRISAIEGRETIKSMVDKSDGRVEIMAGSGINTSNIFDIITATGVKNIHFSASKSRLSGMEVLAGIGKREYLTHSDSKAIEEAKTIISSFK